VLKTRKLLIPAKWTKGRNGQKTDSIVRLLYGDFFENFSVENAWVLFLAPKADHQQIDNIFNLLPGGVSRDRTIEEC